MTIWIERRTLNTRNKWKKTNLWMKEWRKDKHFEERNMKG
jgi:hypothetical protein